MRAGGDAGAGECKRGGIAEELLVEVLGDGESFEVEFPDDAGVLLGRHTLRADQLMTLHLGGHTLRLPASAAQTHDATAAG